MQILTDLHGHTYFSDGRASPEEFVHFRRSLGMRVISVSDHDIMAGVRRTAAAADRLGMLVIPALEVTSFLHFGGADAEQFHVLAYYPPSTLEPQRLERTALFERGRRVQARWREFVLEWLVTLPEADRDAVDPGGQLRLLAPELFPALQSMIDRVVVARRPLFEPFRDHHVSFWDDKELFGWSPEEAIECIRADGALDIVAHPARYRDRARTEKILLEASGVEVYTSRHKAEVAAEYRAFAEKHGKHWTASADDHQNARYVKPPSGTPVHTIERMIRKPIPLEFILAA